MQNYLTLTDQQKNIWNTEMFFPNSSVNHIGGYINIEQKIDSEMYSIRTVLEVTLFKGIMALFNIYLITNTSL